MRPSIAIGVSDFRTLREQGSEYVDKTGLIHEIIDRGAGSFLLPRPRRFGKTLNLSMLRCWFEKRDEDLSRLFEGLEIWEAGDAYRAHFQRYPVLYFSFKDTKYSTFEATQQALHAKIRTLCGEHKHLLTSERVKEHDQKDLRAILDGSATPLQYERAFLTLCQCLHAHHAEKVVVLLDEYDEPIHAGQVNGYLREILEVVWSLLGPCLQDNPHLYKGVLTGSRRIADTSILSGGPQLAVYSLLRVDFHEHFGFSEAEVKWLLDRCGLGDKLDEVRAYYNGYLFGGEVVYNPWSILCFVESGGTTALPYWLSAISNEIIHELIERHAMRLQPLFQTLLEGGSIERRIDETMSLASPRTSQDAFWDLLVFSGYLKAEKAGSDDLGYQIFRLSIPNQEIRQLYATTFAGLRPSTRSPSRFTGRLSA